MKINIKQRQFVSEFLGNFALAWISFGLIAPFFSFVENIQLFVVRLILSLVIVSGLFKVALSLLK